MNSLARLLRLLLLGTLGAAVSATAQTAPNSASAADLAKYDKNKNGRLDPDELAAMQADAAKSSDGVVQLTPFQVNTTKDSGYFAENTLAGSRLNTNLADLAASITVVTKQQMDDTASLDINDVFKYEASTEGSKVPVGRRRTSPHSSMLSAMNSASKPPDSASLASSRK